MCRKEFGVSERTAKRGKTCLTRSVVYSTLMVRKRLFGAVSNHEMAGPPRLQRDRKCYGSVTISTQFGFFPTGVSASTVSVPVFLSMAWLVMLLDSCPTASR